MKPTQRDRVLALLRDAGARGVHTFELRAKFIGNPSQRISELEDRGHRIAHRRERLHGEAIGTRYTLVAEGGVGRASETEAAPGHAAGGTAGSPETTLFDATPRPLGAYEEEAA